MNPAACSGRARRASLPRRGTTLLRRALGSGLALAFITCAKSAGAAVPGPELSATFSIVAFDPRTGEVGAAVQSHWFSVGSLVPWVKAGVGAVCTQSFVEVAYGPRLLDALATGERPDSALARLLRADGQRDVRQVGVVDTRGLLAQHTGRACIVHAGQHAGRAPSGAVYACQGNLLASEEVWTAMGRAFEASTDTSLAPRLLAALEAGQQAGGDARGVQSAALVVERPKSATEPWKNKLVELRVEDSKDPIGELHRVFDVWRAYKLADEGDQRVAVQDYAGAYARYDAALAILPDNDELLFWRGSMGYSSGRPDQALADVERALELNPRWRALLARLDDSLFPGVAEVCRKLKVAR